MKKELAGIIFCCLEKQQPMRAHDFRQFSAIIFWKGRCIWNNINFDYFLSISETKYVKKVLFANLLLRVVKCVDENGNYIGVSPLNKSQYFDDLSKNVFFTIHCIFRRKRERVTARNKTKTFDIEYRESYILFSLANGATSYISRCHE